MPDEVEALLKKSSPEVRALAERTRALVRKEFPAAIEQIKGGGWNALWYGTGSKMYEQVIVIHPGSTYVNLGFARGVELPDPAGLLEGTGTSIRHVKIRDAKDLRAPALKALIHDAVARGGMGRDRRTVPAKKK